MIWSLIEKTNIIWLLIVDLWKIVWRKIMNSVKKYNILGPRTHFDTQNHSSGSQKSFKFPNKIQFFTSFTTQDFFKLDNCNLSKHINSSQRWWSRNIPIWYQNVVFENYHHIQFRNLYVQIYNLEPYFNPFIHSFIHKFQSLWPINKVYKWWATIRHHIFKY